MKAKLLKIFLTVLLFIIFVFLGYFTIDKIINPALKIEFFGDSITYYGYQEDDGYVNNVVKLLKDSGLKVKPIPAGICGQTTRDMLNRLYSDIKMKKPDVVFFMGGINDVWKNRIEFSESKQNLESIISEIKSYGVQLIIISVTIVGEDINSAKNKEIDNFNNYLKDLAKKYDVQYIDVNTVFKNELKKYKNPNGILTIDEVHLNYDGNKILADTIVAEFLKTYKSNN